MTTKWNKKILLLNTYLTSRAPLSAVKNLGWTYVQQPWFLCSSCAQTISAFGYFSHSCFTRSYGKGEICWRQKWKTMIDGYTQPKREAPHLFNACDSDVTFRAAFGTRLCQIVVHATGAENQFLYIVGIIGGCTLIRDNSQEFRSLAHLFEVALRFWMT